MKLSELETVSLYYFNVSGKRNLKGSADGVDQDQTAHNVPYDL